jgi:hypothetical protein
MEPPMKQIGAGSVPPAMSALRQFRILKNIEKVVGPVPVDGPIRVKRKGVPFRSYEVITRRMLIGVNPFDDPASSFN